jgi:hypothetical protein
VHLLPFSIGLSAPLPPNLSHTHLHKFASKSASSVTFKGLLRITAGELFDNGNRDHFHGRVKPEAVRNGKNHGQVRCIKSHIASVSVDHYAK